MKPLVAIAGAYLLGGISLSFSLVMGRLGRDVRELGSGNPGATNVLGLLGAAPALAVLAVDVGKGALAVAAARAWGVVGPSLGAVAAAVVLGHIVPLGHQMRGGKGVATALGAFGVMAPSAVALGLIVFLLAVALTRFVAVGSTAALLALPLLMLAAAGLGLAPRSPRWLPISAAAVALVVLVRHRDNFRRIAVGTEARVGASRKPGGTP